MARKAWAIARDEVSPRNEGYRMYYAGQMPGTEDSRFAPNLNEAKFCYDLQEIYHALETMVKGGDILANYVIVPVVIEVSIANDN